jgi:hypothetical protein
MKPIRVMSFVATLAVALLPALACAQSSDAYIRQPVRFNRTFNRTLADGCTYTVRVNGTVTPLPGQANKSVPRVSPNMSVAAEAVCPNMEAVKVSDNILGDGPLTWNQLADSLARRSRVTTVEQTHRCTYDATFNVTRARLDIANVDYHCTAI